MDGIITAIHGEQNPGSIKRLGGGCMVMGGIANMDIVFTGHHAHTSRGTPESIIRGVQWYIGDEIADSSEIQEAFKAAQERKTKEENKAKVEADQRDQTRTALPDKYPHLARYDKNGKISHYALGAKNIKVELAKAFPGIKFSAKSESYSGGNSIRVSWVDGPVEAEVNKIIRKYQEGSFDGMDDLYSYDKSNVWPDVFGGAKYVSGSRNESKALRTLAAKELGYNLTDANFDQWTNLAGLEYEIERMIYRQAREMTA